MHDRRAPSVPSLLLQALLSVHQLYLYVFLGITLALFVYKGVMLPYPPTGAFGWEIVFVVLYYCVASTRLFQASKGNQTRQVGALLLALVLAMPLIVCQVYFLQLQTYVLRLDAILNGIALGLICAETLLCLLTLLLLLRRGSL